MEVIIIDSIKERDDYIYELNVEKNGQSWLLVRSLTQFRQFFDDLYAQFPTYSLPYIPDEWMQNSTDEFYLRDLKQKLQNFILDLGRIPFVRGNQSFKQFLEID